MEDKEVRLTFKQFMDFLDDRNFVITDGFFANSEGRKILNDNVGEVVPALFKIIYGTATGTSPEDIDECHKISTSTLSEDIDKSHKIATSTSTEDIDKCHKIPTSTSTEDIDNCYKIATLTEDIDKSHNIVATTSQEDKEECHKMAAKLVDIVNPKEALVFYLEQFETYTNVDILPYLRDILLKLPSKRGASFEWVLSTIRTPIEALELPEEHNLEAEERKLMDMDPYVHNIAEILPAYVKFLTPFVDEVRLARNDASIKDTIAEFIMDIFGHPLLYMDLHHSLPDAKSTLRVVAENLLRCLVVVEPNLLKLLVDRVELTSSDFSIDDLKFEMAPEHQKQFLRGATVAYLLIGEDTGVAINSVYNPIYLYQRLIKYSVVLLVQTRYLAIHKGLLMTEALLNSIPDATLNRGILDMPETTILPSCLFRIMIYCQNQELRRKALSIFRLYIAKFDAQSCASVLATLIKIVKHAGAAALIIQMFKNGYHKDGAEHFGKLLPQFLLDMIRLGLPQGAETDLLDQSEVILGGLNFLRYLFQIEAHPSNVKQLLPRIKEQFLEPLRMGLNLSKSHYKLELNDADRPPTEGRVETTVAVGGINLPPLIRKQVCESALVMFDMMGSVLSRLEEIVAIAKF